MSQQDGKTCMQCTGCLRQNHMSLTSPPSTTHSHHYRLVGTSQAELNKYIFYTSLTPKEEALPSLPHDPLSALSASMRD